MEVGGVAERERDEVEAAAIDMNEGPDANDAWSRPRSVTSVTAESDRTDCGAPLAPAL